MEKSLKELLLKDLSARLPYGVICQFIWTYSDETTGEESIIAKGDDNIRCIDIHTKEIQADYYGEWVDLEHCKSYLRPMSSMTEEEKEDLLKTIFKKASNKFYVDKKGIIDGKPTDLMTEGLNSVLFGPKTVTLYMDWLLKHHFDFNNLIKRKLALPAPPDMYK